MADKFRNLQEASDAFFKEVPGWYADRAELFERWKPGFKDVVSRYDKVVDIEKIVTYSRSRGKCYKKTTYLFSRLFLTLRTGTKCYVLQDSFKERLFVVQYSTIIAKISFKALGKSITDYMTPNTIKELLKEFVPLFGAEMEKEDVEELLERAKKFGTDLTAAHKESNQLLAQFGKCVGEWDVKDELFIIQRKRVGRKTYKVKIPCTPAINGLAEGKEGLREREYLQTPEGLKPELEKSFDRPDAEKTGKLIEKIEKAVEEEEREREDDGGTGMSDEKWQGRKFRFVLKQIEYKGDNVGRDLQFQFRIGAQTALVKKRIKHGSKASFSIVLFEAVLPFDFKNFMSIQIQGVEKDKYSDVGSASIVVLLESLRSKKTVKPTLVIVGDPKGNPSKQGVFKMQIEVETSYAGILV